MEMSYLDLLSRCRIRRNSLNGKGKYTDSQESLLWKYSA